MKAAYDYTKRINDEVDLHAGEEVTVLEPGNFSMQIFNFIINQ